MRAPPTCRLPVGDGAKRTRTCQGESAVKIQAREFHSPHSPRSGHANPNQSELTPVDRPLQTFVALPVPLQQMQRMLTDGCVPSCCTGQLDRDATFRVRTVHSVYKIDHSNRLKGRANLRNCLLWVCGQATQTRCRQCYHNRLCRMTLVEKRTIKEGLCATERTYRLARCGPAKKFTQRQASVQQPRSREWPASPASDNVLMHVGPRQQAARHFETGIRV